MIPRASTGKLRLVVLISGGGSNLQALIDACTKGELDAQICLVISNQPNAGGLKRATAVGIPNLVIDHQNFGCRETFDQALIETIHGVNPDLVILVLCVS